MTQYRRKPQLIEAFQWTGGIDQNEDPVWAVEAIREGNKDFTRGPSLRIDKHSDQRPMISAWNLGDMAVCNYMPGCYVMRMPEGRFMSDGYIKIMLEDEFLALYEPA